MKTIKTMMIALMMCFTQMSFSQESFETKNVSVFGTTLKMKINFTIYSDSLIMEYLDSKTIKSNEEMGLPNKSTYPYKFEKVELGKIITYASTEDNIRIIVNKTKDKWTVSMTTKDTFTGQTSDILYY